MAPFTNTTDSPIIALTDLAVTEIGRKDLGVVAYRYAGFAVGREGYLDSDPVKTDAIVTADTALRDQVGPRPYGDDVLLVGHFNDAVGGSLDLDYVRDGGDPSGTATGNATIAQGTPTFQAAKFGGGALDLVDVAHASVAYTGRGIIDGLVQEGNLSLWYKANYAGSPPPVNQYIFASGDEINTNNRNGLILYHATDNKLHFQVFDYQGDLIAHKQFTHNPGPTYNHLEANFDVENGATRLSLNGTQQGSVATGTGIRTANSQVLLLGEPLQSAVGGLVNNYYLDELIARDKVQHVGDFAVPTAEFDPITLFEFASYKVTGPDVLTLVCRLLPDDALFGLGELGVWAEVTFDASDPSRVGEKFLFAICHFPFNGKTSREVSAWNIDLKS